MAINYCGRTLQPLFLNDIEMLSHYVAISIDPLLKLMDAELYELLYKNQELA